MAQIARPTSPHLTVYRWQLTMVLSIVHRATGVGLAVGTLLMIAALLALASGPEAYAAVQAVCASKLGLLFLFGWTWALCYHLCNGVRHLVWDTGWGFEIPRTYLTGWLVVAVSALMTLAIWACVLVRGGGA